MKHNPSATAHAVGTTTAIVYVVCALGFLLLPDLSIAIAWNWFHGIDIRAIASPTITAGSFIFGLITSTLAGWLMGYLYASLYNGFVGKKGR